MNAIKKLKLVLKANAIFSTLCGLALVFFHEAIAEMMNIGTPMVLLVIGIGLLGFAGILFWTTTRPEINAKQVQSIIVQDWLWVAGSALVIIFQVFGISLLGYVIIGVVALVVADFAILQSRFLRRI